LKKWDEIAKAKKEERKKERRDDFNWLVKFLLTWAVVSVVSMFAIAAAYQYGDVFWVTVFNSIVVGLLATVIMLCLYDGLKGRLQ
jgi:hypothetical protein